MSRLQGLKAKGIQLKISSGLSGNSSELGILAKHSQLSLSLYYTFCLFVFKHAAAYLCLFSLLIVLCPCLFNSVLTLFPSFCLLRPLSFSLSLSLFQKFFFLPPFIFFLICIPLSLFPDAEVHYVNMTALTKGHLLSSFWVVDRRHFYIGSASMDWRSLATVLKKHIHAKICTLTQKQASCSTLGIILTIS